MDFVVTEAGVEARVPGGLERVTPETARARLLELAARRELPRRVPPG
jgi:hypothetical protein